MVKTPSQLDDKLTVLPVDKSKVAFGVDNLNSGLSEDLRLDDLENFITPSFTVEEGITASVTQTQGQQPLTAQINEIATVATTDDVVTLPGAIEGASCKVINAGVNRLQIFPDVGHKINNLATDAADSIAPGTSITYHAINNTTWYS